MGEIIKIDDKNIKKSLENKTRQYFVGNLSKPQALDYVKDERLEIGISNYPVDTSEPAHVHSVATEYQFVVNGHTKYMDVETAEIYEFHKGDFYAIFPGTKYVQKIDAGTTILFIKTPSINDKKIVELPEEQKNCFMES